MLVLILPGMRFLSVNPILFFAYFSVVASHTWKCPDVRGEGPVAREAHSAALVGNRLFIFGGCGKTSESDDEVFYNDLYIFNTGILPYATFLVSVLILFIYHL